MPTLAQISAKSSAVLTALETDKIREIAGLSAVLINSGETPINLFVNQLTPERRQVLRAEIDAWDAVVDSYVKLAGGQDGVDFNQERARMAIRKRVLDTLGIDASRAGDSNRVMRA